MSELSMDKAGTGAYIQAHPRRSPHLIDKPLVMRRQTRPFTVETKNGHSRAQARDTWSASSQEEGLDPFPQDVPERDVREDLARDGRSDARREAERVFGGLRPYQLAMAPASDKGTHAHPTPVPAVSNSRSEAAAEDAPISRSPAAAASAQAGEHVPRVLPDLLAQARDESRPAASAPVRQRRSRRPVPEVPPQQHALDLELGPVDLPALPEGLAPAPLRDVPLPEPSSALSSDVPPRASLAPELNTDAALGAAQVLSRTGAEAALRLKRRRDARAERLPAGQRWKERRLPRVCWER